MTTCSDVVGNGKMEAEIDVVSGNAKGSYRIPDAEKANRGFLDAIDSFFKDLVGKFEGQSGAATKTKNVNRRVALLEVLLQGFHGFPDSLLTASAENGSKKLPYLSPSCSNTLDVETVPGAGVAVIVGIIERQHVGVFAIARIVFVSGSVKRI